MDNRSHHPRAALTDSIVVLGVALLAAAMALATLSGGVGHVVAATVGSIH